MKGNGLQMAMYLLLVNRLSNALFYSEKMLLIHEIDEAKLISINTNRRCDDRSHLSFY